MWLNSIRALKNPCNATIGLFVYLTLAMPGCHYRIAAKWQYTEIKRVKSPNSQVEAVLVEGDGGATTSAVSKIYLVTAGAKLQLGGQDDSDVFAADHLKGFNIAWKEPGLLEFQYEEARILGFRNYWYGHDANNARLVVELRLRPGTNSYALPRKDRLL